MLEYLFLNTGFPVWVCFAGLIAFALEIMKNE